MLSQLRALAVKGKVVLVNSHIRLPGSHTTADVLCPGQTKADHI
jgi:hypothetical protein